MGKTKKILVACAARLRRAPKPTAVVTSLILPPTFLATRQSVWFLYSKPCCILFSIRTYLSRVRTCVKASIFPARAHKTVFRRRIESIDRCASEKNRRSLCRCRTSSSSSFIRRRRRQRRFRSIRLVAPGHVAPGDRRRRRYAGRNTCRRPLQLPAAWNKHVVRGKHSVHAGSRNASTGRLFVYRTILFFVYKCPRLDAITLVRD